MRCDSAALKRSRSSPFVGSDNESMRISPPVRAAAAGAWVGCGCAGGAVGFGGALASPPEVGVAGAGAAAVVGGAAGAAGPAGGVGAAAGGGAWHAARSED